MKTRLLLLLPLAWLMLVPTGCGEDGDTVIVQDGDGPDGPAEPATAVEACSGCHGPSGILPVADIEAPGDAHFIDTDPDGPLTAAGYRQIDVAITSVDVSGSSVVIEFTATDEDGGAVTDLFAGDGRFTIAQLLAPAPLSGDPTMWTSLITRTENPGAIGTGDGTTETQATAEGFGSGTFQNLTAGNYRYTSSFDPSSAPFLEGDTLRVAIQISAGDLPAGNGWCDFDADLTTPPNTDCDSASLTRDIVQTATCNECHGSTSDTQLALHGGGRTEMEYCVTCHNPFSVDANSDNNVDMSAMTHAIHYGAQRATPYQIWGFRNSLHDYSNVNFTKSIDDCQVCHEGGGADVDNWHMVPTRLACGGCHDDVDFDSGENHPPPGGQQPDNSLCVNCHPSSGPIDTVAVEYPVQTVHRGAAVRLEADLYTGGGNGFEIVSTDFSGGDLTVEYRVTRNGTPMNLDTDPEWTAPFGASRLALIVGWSTSDYTNEGSGSEPANPVSVNALDVGGAVTDLGGGLYEAVIDLPSGAEGTVTVALEGHPAASIGGSTERIPVLNVFEHVNTGGPRSSLLPRRQVVAIEKCNECHGAAGQGISLHGNNRTGSDIVCAVCHNANNTDIEVRPADPMDALDGKPEETIDFKRMIHQIHVGSGLEDGLVIYGFGGTPHDYGHVNFIGNLANCETCHIGASSPMDTTYGTLEAGDTLPTTILTGEDLEDPSDDLNISPVAAVCQGCHDDAASVEHMELHGSAFSVLDENVQ